MDEDGKKLEHLEEVETVVVAVFVFVCAVTRDAFCWIGGSVFGARVFCGSGF